MNEVAKPSDPISQLRDKVQEKIASELGSMMPKEMIDQIVSDSIKALLYKNVRNDTYSTPLPFITDEVNKYTRQYINKAIIDYFETDQAQIKALVAKHFEENLPNMLSSIFFGFIKGGMGGTAAFTHNLMNETLNEFRNNGRGY